MLQIAVANALPARPCSDRAAHLSIVGVFLVHGMLFASWTAHVPLVKAKLALTDAQLGISLLGAPIGAVLLMIAGGKLLSRWGSRVMVQWSLLGYGLSGPLIGQTTGMPSLFAALFVWGGCQGLLDVAMNTQAVAIEHAQERPLMSGLHGCWSVGALVGATLGAFGAGRGLSLSVQLLALGAPALGVIWLAHRNLLHADAGAAAGKRGALVWTPELLVLAVVAFAGMLCEGAAADWAAVYMHDGVGASVEQAGFAYAGFALMMVIIRFSGDRLTRRFGPWRLVAVLALLASVAMAAALASGQPRGALLGFAALGLGLGSIVPVVFSAAGRLPGVSPGVAIAIVSALGWFGFMLGPPAIGFLAARYGLGRALLILPVLTLVVASVAVWAQVRRVGRR